MRQTPLSREAQVVREEVGVLLVRGRVVAGTGRVGDGVPEEDEARREAEAEGDAPRGEPAGVEPPHGEQGYKGGRRGMSDLLPNVFS